VEAARRIRQDLWAFAVAKPLRGEDGRCEAQKNVRWVWNDGQNMCVHENGDSRYRVARLEVAVAQ
jgi:hypothetical protein